MGSLLKAPEGLEPQKTMKNAVTAAKNKAFFTGSTFISPPDFYFFT